MFAHAVYDALGPSELFGMQEILALLEAQPQLASMNAGFERNAGYRASVAAEQARSETEEVE